MRERREGVTRTKHGKIIERGIESLHFLKKKKNEIKFLEIFKNSFGRKEEGGRRQKGGK